MNHSTAPWFGTYQRTACRAPTPNGARLVPGAPAFPVACIHRLGASTRTEEPSSAASSPNAVVDPLSFELRTSVYV